MGAGRLLISIYCLFTRPRLLIHTFQLLCNTLRGTARAFKWTVVHCLLMFSNAKAKSSSVSQQHEGNGWGSRSYSFPPTFFRNEDENRIVNTSIHSHNWGIFEWSYQKGQPYYILILKRCSLLTNFFKPTQTHITSPGPMVHNMTI